MAGVPMSGLQTLDSTWTETPDTALTAEQRSIRNLGKARKAFLGVIAETAACTAKWQVSPRHARGGARSTSRRRFASTRADSHDQGPAAIQTAIASASTNISSSSEVCPTECPLFGRVSG